jgi:hypothetical protein
LEYQVKEEQEKKQVLLEEEKLLLPDDQKQQEDEDQKPPAIEQNVIESHPVVEQVQYMPQQVSNVPSVASCVSLSPSKLPPEQTFDADAATLGEPITLISGNRKKQIAI